MVHLSANHQYQILANIQQFLKYILELLEDHG